MMPVSLESLNLNHNKFSGGIPAEWSSMMNLKELKMVACGLDGECCVASSDTAQRIEKRIAQAMCQSRSSRCSAL